MFKRSGFYFNNSTASIPVGGATLYSKSKIHSSHPDFDKINIKYFMGYLIHESNIQRGMWGMYREFDGTIPVYKTESTPIEPIVISKESIGIIEEPNVAVEVESKEAYVESAVEVASEAPIEVGPEPEVIETFTEEIKVVEKPKKKKKVKVEDPS